MFPSFDIKLRRKLHINVQFFYSPAPSVSFFQILQIDATWLRNLDAKLQQTLQRQNVQIAQLQSQPALLYRTCEELRSFGRHSGSGGYLIDPDGVAIGAPPMYVQCNMTMGSSVSLWPTTRQWVALMKLSQSCTLDNLECSGRATVNQIPATCEDLWKVGHTLNGLYDVKSNKTAQSVYCDFTKLPGDQGEHFSVSI